MVTTLLSKPFGKKVEQYYSENGSNYSGTKFSPTTVNIINTSIRSLEVISLLLLWRRARFILLPTFVNILLTYNLHHTLNKDADLKYFDKNLNSAKENYQHRRLLLSDKATNEDEE